MQDGNKKKELSNVNDVYDLGILGKSRDVDFIGYDVSPSIISYIVKNNSLATSRTLFNLIRECKLSENDIWVLLKDRRNDLWAWSQGILTNQVLNSEQIDYVLGNIELFGNKASIHFYLLQYQKLDIDKHPEFVDRIRMSKTLIKSTYSIGINLVKNTLCFSGFKFDEKYVYGYIYDRLESLSLPIYNRRYPMYSLEVVRDRRETICNYRTKMIRVGIEDIVKFHHPISGLYCEKKPEILEDNINIWRWRR